MLLLRLFEYPDPLKGWMPGDGPKSEFNGGPLINAAFAPFLVWAVVWLWPRLRRRSKVAERE